MSLNYERVRYQQERCVIQQDIGLTKVVNRLQNKLCLNAKTPKKNFFQLRSILPHTAKNTLTSLDAFRWVLRRKASADADELYAALNEFHHAHQKVTFLYLFT
jgi:hypothetical protein